MKLIFSDFFRELSEFTMMLRIILSVICGGIIGLERGVKGRAAGFRTHILVCMGSAIAMMTGQYAFMFISQNSDPTRIGAQVISGIGFLGVGTIITTKSLKVKGLTTAAGLWTSACLGLAIGIGFYEAAITGTLAVTVAMILFQKIDRFFYRKSRVRDYYIEIRSIQTIRQIMEQLNKNGYKIVAMEYEQSGREKNEPMGMVLSVKRTIRGDVADVITVLGAESDIVFIEAL